MEHHDRQRRPTWHLEEEEVAKVLQKLSSKCRQHSDYRTLLNTVIDESQQKTLYIVLILIQKHLQWLFVIFLFLINKQ